MSKKNYKNYQNYSGYTAAPVEEPAVENPVVEEPVVEVTETVEEIEEVVEAAVEEVAEEPVAAPAPLVGVVAGCERLNIRVKPDITASKVSEVKVGTVLMIETAESTDEWYKIYTEAGVEGFCMKKFVELRG